MQDQQGSFYVNEMAIFKMYTHYLLIQVYFMGFEISQIQTALS